MKLYYPAKPYVVTQKWGIHRPEIYAQFGYTDHNGEDFRLGADKKIYAPFNGEIVKMGNQSGGGIFLGYLSDEEYDFEDGKRARVLFDALHLEKVTGTVGVKYKIGDELAIADNTGFSTGPHTHGQWRRVIKLLTGLQEIDDNEANNSFDPTPYWDGYAVDYKNLRTQVSILQKILSLLKNALLKTS